MQDDHAEALLAAILESSDDAIILETPDGVIMNWSRGAERIFGYRSKEAIGRPVSILAAPGAADDMAQVLDRAKRGERIEHYEVVHQHKNGTVLDVSLTIRPIKDRAGQVTAYAKIVRDLTATKSALQSVEEGEAKLRAIIDAIPDGMIVMDERGIVRSFSPAAERIFGYTPAEVCGNNVSMLMPPPDREQHDGYLARYRRSGERRIIGIGRTVVGRRKDGSTFPMDLAVGEVRSHGQWLFTGFVRDVSERRQSEARIVELQSELLHVSRLSAMGQMAAVLAHELNQPLTAVINYGEAARQLLLVAEGSVPPRALEFIQKASGQAERAGEIIRRLRRFVERRGVERSSESLNDVVQEATSLATIGAKVDAIQIAYRLTDDLPPIDIDRTQIQQVIVNLVRNAVEILGDAQRRIVTIGTRLTEQDVQEVAVSDTGPGVSPEVADRLFQPFVSNKNNGMGIGLSICRSIIEAHGGQIWAEVNTDGGAVFRFTLPRANP